MSFIAWDIETDTSGGFGLDPNQGGILSIAASHHTGEPDRTPGDVFYQSTGLLSEADIILGFDEWLSTREGVMVGWFSAGFDAPFVFRRAELLGLSIGLSLRFDPDIPLKYDPLPGFHGGYRHSWSRSGFRDCFDLAIDAYTADRCRASGVRHSLKPVARDLGLDPVEVERDRIHCLSDAGLREYNLSDVMVTAALYERWVVQARETVDFVGIWG